MLADTSSENVTISEQVLTIQDIHTPQPVEIPNATSLTNRITNVGVESRDHTIKDFLARPRVIADGTITAGGSGGELLQSFSFPNDLLTLSTIRDKTKGFLMLRSNIRIRIIFTAPPTAAGGIRIVIAPDLDASLLIFRTTTQLQQSQFPNNIYSLSNLPDIEMRLPWISQYTHRNLTQNSPNPQKLLMFRTTPSSVVVSYKIYANFITDDEDFSLTQATPAVPYFDTFSLTKDEEKEILKYRSVKLKSQVMTEAKATQGGLSGIANTVGAVASTLSGLPVIGSIASTIAPIANLAGSIFSAFGWSKPNNEKPTEPIKNQPTTSQVNCDNTHNSHTFGVQMLNRVETTPGSYGTTTDDMHFDKMLRHPNYVSSFQVSTSDVARKVLLALPITPYLGSVIPQFTTNSNQQVSFTHQAFVTSLFQNWYSSIVLNFYLFTTQFHSAKLRFIVAPGHYSANLPANIDDSNSIVVNFGTNTTHQVKFPAITNRQFLTNPLTAFKNNNGGVGLFDESTSFGYLFVVVEIPMQVTSTIVAPTVDGIVEMHMHDSRFFQMLDLPLIPVDPTFTSDLTPDFWSLPSEEQDKIVAKAAAKDKAKTKTATLESHSATTYATENMPSSSDTIEYDLLSANNMDATKHPLKAYAICSGEAIVSFKQIISQFTTPTKPSTGATATRLSYNPFAISQYPSNVLDADKIDYVLSAFGFRKGSAHVRMFVNTDRPKPLNLTLNSTTGDTSKITNHTTNGPHLINSMLRTIPIVTNLEGIVDVHVPYYQQYHIVRNQSVVSTTDTRNVARPITVDIINDSTNNLWISRAMGDDFSAGFILGLPNFRLYNAPYAIDPIVM